MGKKINFKALEKNLKLTWTKNGGMNFIDMVHFEDREDYKKHQQIMIRTKLM